MGIFGIIRLIREEKKRQKAYLMMTEDDLVKLDDDYLYDALSSRILSEESNKDVSECLQTFQKAKRVFYIVNYFDSEVQNGGLCQFFVNSSREVAPYVLECLDLIGATKYKSLLSEFIAQNNISLDDLESFIIYDADEFEEQNERYPFDDFDDSYYELYEQEPLNEKLTTYARNNIKDFC